VSGARQRSDGVEKYSSIASRQAPEHGSTASSCGPDARISAATLSAQLMQTPARSIPQPVQLQQPQNDSEPTQPSISGTFFWEQGVKRGGLRSETAQLFSRSFNQTSMTAMILWFRSTMMI
jgi:hypothetical protein